MLRRRVLGIVIALAVMLMAFTASPVAHADTLPAPHTPAGWTLRVSDDWDSGTIPSYWSVYDGPYGSGPKNCAIPSQVQDVVTQPGNVGYLTLTMAYLTNVNDPNCPYQTGWFTGGMQISSADNFSQQDVYLRWREVPATDINDHHIIPMLWPDDPNYQWYQAEADYCESSSTASCTTYLHYSQTQQISHTYTTDLTQWHDWEFLEQGNTLTVWEDNTQIYQYVGDATTFPEAMRRLVFQQECPAAGCPSSAYAGETTTIQIDWDQIYTP